jgi:hypothetical protein
MEKEKLQLRKIIRKQSNVKIVNQVLNKNFNRENYGSIGGNFQNVVHFGNSKSLTNNSRRSSPEDGQYIVKIFVN